MGCLGSEVRCRRHPNHVPTPGVCAACLRERLSRLNSPFSPLSLSSLSSSTSSSCSSSSSFVDNGRISFLLSKEQQFMSDKIEVPLPRSKSEAKGLRESMGAEGAVRFWFFKNQKKKKNGRLETMGAEEGSKRRGRWPLSGSVKGLWPSSRKG
ncbi:hypothetical protein AMTRI_Chr04g183320 [Amborella trichopoda]|uniref:Uncharacterized protein n=1 Tax=Amborella trichopoda TaxID=13333 RepID=W1NIV1_AMBTC|nr:hypothetical protein AMTR_s00008p00222650 [Amborella trichopoda]